MRLLRVARIVHQLDIVLHEDTIAAFHVLVLYPVAVPTLAQVGPCAVVPLALVEGAATSDFAGPGDEGSSTCSPREEATQRPNLALRLP